LLNGKDESCYDQYNVKKACFSGSGIFSFINGHKMSVQKKQWQCPTSGCCCKRRKVGFTF